MRLASAYMARRQVQKLSRADNRYSVFPAMARWNAWLCALGMPGTTMPSMRSAGGKPVASPAVSRRAAETAADEAHRG
jgi:hypothetical protein